MESGNNSDKKSFSRRKFLKRGAIILGGTMVTIYFGRGPIRRFAAKKIEALDVPSIISTYHPDFWFEVLPDNTVLMRSPKVEMGQGIFTGFAMLAAEELEVPLDQIKVEHANTSTGPVDMVNTGGSNSTSSLYVAIREVAATMREMLREAAAAQWGVKVSDIAVQNGVLTAGGRQMTYAEVTASTTEWKIPKTPALKPASEFNYVGKEVKRIDLVPKVMGEPLFGIDKNMPGMLYAVILQSPYIGGVLKTINTEEAAQTAGVIKIIQEKDLVAVVAENRYAAEVGLNKIEAEWDIPKKWNQPDMEEIVMVGRGTKVSVQNDGRAGSVIAKKADRVYRQEYRTPMAVHAHMEPNGAVAHVEGDKARVIIGTQAPGLVRDQVAAALGMKKKQVTVEVAYLGGGFGRRVHLNNAAQAALISRIVGRPVHVFNTREQEFQNGHFRPNTHHVLQAVIGEDGAIEAITHDQATPDFVLEAAAGPIAVKIAGADFISAGHGASIMYHIKNRCASVWHSKYPLTTGIWRSVGMFPNTFAIESFINELAHETGKDPIAMRLDLLAGPENIHRRYKTVLETLVEKSGWDTPKAAGTGRGIAIADDRKAIAAAVAEVSVTGSDIRVTKMTLVTDVGMSINPEGIRMQVESCIMMGITAALYEELQIEDSQVAGNFHLYPMATLKDTPEMEIVILEGDDKPYGVGEPPLAPIAPAIAAAVFDATGKRLRVLPLKLMG
jgi:isoquinoline 1-oxidoreductase subunit beta